MTKPYRANDDEIRYVCMVCWTNAARAETECPTCRVALSDTRIPEIHAEVLRVLRDRARKRSWNYDARRVAIAVPVGAVLAGLGFVVLIATGVYRPPERSVMVGMGSFGPLFLLWFLLAPVLYYALALVLRRPPAPLPNVDHASLSELIVYLSIRTV
jgi:hypothetical protein